VKLVAEQSGKGRQTCAALAQAWDHANLTRTQAQAAALWSQGHTYRDIAAHLALTYQQARRIVRAAERKVKEHHSHLLALDRRTLKAILSCIRNIRPSGSGRLHVYAPLPGGGHDDQPYGMPARLDGECVEDHREPGRFLRALPWLLAQHAREAADELAECAVVFCG
jgi:DNA-binding CsgD family transcriptional regulator